MYHIENGLLYKDDVPVFAVGVSYYASYFPPKMPVKPEDDAYGQAALDIADIKNTGFNIVRCAARGDFGLDEGGKVWINTPLIDYIVERCGIEGLAAAVRINGYSMDLHGYEHIRMWDCNDHEFSGSEGGFIPNCCFHKGVIADNDTSTQAFARHFASFANVVGYQIYNEPCYQSTADYNPAAIAAYREQLVENGVLSRDEAKTYDPPRDYMKKCDRPEELQNYRLFLSRGMNHFLALTAEAAKKACPDRAVFTCGVNTPLMLDSVRRGYEHYEMAGCMDIVGISLYGKHRGKGYYETDRYLCGAESMAAACNKHAWVIEYDASNRIDPSDIERETYHAVGCGFKGILYYQWRVDADNEGGPEIGVLGLIDYERKPRNLFATAKVVTAMLNEIGTRLVASERMRGKVGILYSPSANAHSYAYTDDIVITNDGRSSYRIITPIKRMEKLTDILTDRQIHADQVCAWDLAKNAVGNETLFVPCLDGLTPDESDEIEYFARNHNVYICTEQNDVFIDYQTGESVTLCDCKLPRQPIHTQADYEIGAFVTESSSEYIISLVNRREDGSPVDNVVILLREDIAANSMKAVMVTPYGSSTVDKTANTLTIPRLDSGCIIFLTKTS